jgi:hypothetical protein
LSYSAEQLLEWLSSVVQLCPKVAQLYGNKRNIRR